MENGKIQGLSTGYSESPEPSNKNLTQVIIIIQSNRPTALSALLFVTVMEAISREFRVALPWELLYADDLVVIAETEEELIKRLNEWKDNVQNNNSGFI